MDNWLDNIVQCPKCKQEVREGDKIWLDGECLCPKCYEYKRFEIETLRYEGYKQAMKNSKRSWEG